MHQPTKRAKIANVPEGANIFIAEDDVLSILLEQQIVENGGHKVRLTARTFAEAKSAVDKFGEEKIHVAILDRNLTTGKYDGSEGDQLLAKINQMWPNVKTVGMSSGSFPGTDVDLRYNLDELEKTVRSL